jgi:DNA-binding transcriptional regulator YiaG
MANLATVLKDEIRRLARKELKEEFDALRKGNAQHRRDIADLKRKVSDQARLIDFLQRQEKRRLSSAPQTEQADGARFSAKGLKSHRMRLGLSAKDFSLLVGVSELTIYNWEAGKSKPRNKQLASLVTVRSLGKREALRRLKLLNA